MNRLLCANRQVLKSKSVLRRCFSDKNRPSLADAVVGSNPMFPVRPRPMDALDLEQEKTGKDKKKEQFAPGE